MTEITILIPVHEYNDTVQTYLDEALNSVEKNKKYFNGVLKPVLVGPSNVLNEIKNDVVKLVNDGATDFCSQINFGANNCDSDYFSILEYDDIYMDKWFKMVQNYFYGNEDVSVFLPINVQKNVQDESYKFENEIVWASSFSNEMGYIDNDCLQHYLSFNLTGGIFNKNDFIKVGGLKSSIKAAFNYEFLLRITNKKLKVFVVPKEGYEHRLLRDGSLITEYLKMDIKDTDEWFKLAKRESKYTEDRHLSINSLKNETVK